MNVSSADPPPFPGDMTQPYDDDHHPALIRSSRRAIDPGVRKQKPRDEGEAVGGGGEERCQL